MRSILSTKIVWGTKMVWSTDEPIENEASTCRVIFTSNGRDTAKLPETGIGADRQARPEVVQAVCMCEYSHRKLLASSSCSLHKVGLARLDSPNDSPNLVRSSRDGNQPQV